MIAKSDTRIPYGARCTWWFAGVDRCEERAEDIAFARAVLSKAGGQ